MEDCRSLEQRTRALLSRGVTKIMLRDTRHSDVLSACLLEATRPLAPHNPDLQSIRADLAAGKPRHTFAQS